LCSKADGLEEAEESTSKQTTEPIMPATTIEANKEEKTVVTPEIPVQETEAPLDDKEAVVEAEPVKVQGTDEVKEQQAAVPQEEEAAAPKDETENKVLVQTASNPTDLSAESKVVSPTTTNNSILTSPTIAAPSTSDPIEAIDALEDALEEVGKILPQVGPLSPEKPVRQIKKPNAKVSSSVNLNSALSKSSLKPIVFTPGPSLSKSTTQLPAATRSTTARNHTPLKLAVAPKTNRQSTAAPTQATKETDGKHDSTKPVDYLARKRRPISISFPTPPPPAKSTKPPTKPTFTLPGDAIAAKRKAALEERLKKEQEEQAKKREFKARPAPNTSKPRPTSTLVRPTAASTNRQSVAAGASGSEKENKPNGLKRAGTVTGATSTATKERMAAKRATILEASKTTANTAAKRTGATAPSTTSTIPKRTSIFPRSLPTRSAADATSRSLSSSTASAKPLSTDDKAALKVKGRTMINRDRMEKEEKEKEKKHKDELAKKARAEAVERSRETSRQWAAKKKGAAGAKGVEQKADSPIEIKIDGPVVAEEEAKIVSEEEGKPVEEVEETPDVLGAGNVCQGATPAVAV
jgi:hypothetical protein